MQLGIALIEKCAAHGEIVVMDYDLSFGGDSEAIGSWLEMEGRIMFGRIF